MTISAAAEKGGPASDRVIKLNPVAKAVRQPRNLARRSLDALEGNDQRIGASALVVGELTVISTGAARKTSFPAAVSSHCVQAGRRTKAQTERLTK